MDLQAPLSWILFHILNCSGISNLSQDDFYTTKYHTCSINQTMETYILSPYVFKTELQLLSPLVSPKTFLKHFYSILGRNTKRPLPYFKAHPIQNTHPYLKIGLMV